jgi:hypothetical protein
MIEMNDPEANELSGRYFWQVVVSLLSDICSNFRYHWGVPDTLKLIMQAFYDVCCKVSREGGGS